eukprot:3287241-Prymnesium_polylepis.1
MASGRGTTQLSPHSASALRTSWSSTRQTCRATQFASASPRRSQPTSRAPTSRWWTTRPGGAQRSAAMNLGVAYGGSVPHDQE